MKKILDIVFSKVMILSIFVFNIVSLLFYSLYLEKYPATFTHNSILVDNKKLVKRTCEMYNDNPNTICTYFIDNNSTTSIDLPQRIDPFTNKEITIFIKSSKLRHVIYIKNNTNNIINSVENIKIQTIIKMYDEYKIYCDYLHIPYCERNNETY